MQPREPVADANHMHGPLTRRPRAMDTNQTCDDWLRLEKQTEATRPLQLKPKNSTTTGEEDLWRWVEPGERRDEGYTYYRSLEHAPFNSSTRRYTVGNVVIIDSSMDDEVWFAQVLAFYSTDETTDGMYMRLRWLYTKPQVIARQNQNQQASLRGISSIRSNELLWSDHVEHEANHALNIQCTVNVAQNEEGYARLLQEGKSASTTYIIRYYYNFYLSQYTEEPLLRRLKPLELKKILRKPHAKEKFYQPLLEKQARRFVDSEAQVSTAICIDDERERETRRSIRKVKKTMKTVLQKEIESSKEREFELEQRLVTMKNDEQVKLEEIERRLNESNKAMANISREHNLKILELENKLKGLENKDSEEICKSVSRERKLKRRMESNEKFKKHVLRKSEKRKRYRENKKKKKKKKAAEEMKNGRNL